MGNINFDEECAICNAPDQEVTIDHGWYKTLLENNVKYRTLINYLFNQAELRINQADLRKDGELSIYVNSADILKALEPGSYAWTCDTLKMKEQEV